MLKARLIEVDIASIPDDPLLHDFAIRYGAEVYKTGCVYCHGPDGKGLQIGWFPNLADEDWLWGGSLPSIYFTVKHGIRDWHDPDARWSDMPGYGDMDLLSDEESEQVANFVLSLSGPAEDPDLVEAGRSIFEIECAGCHRLDATGDQDVGAPNLADSIWLGPGRYEDILFAIWEGREHVMPSWAKELSDPDIRAVAIYVEQLNAEGTP